ncbi:MAG: sigma-70 family RNA polymerase sigma factor [Verrucomicrobiota bacterium]
MSDPEDESSLALEAARGDESAFRLLVERFESRVVRLAFRISDDFHAAEDIAQESFVRAYQSLHSFDPDKGNFSSWLFRITKNTALNHRRKRIPIPADIDESSQQGREASPDFTCERIDEMRRLDVALNQLKEPYRSTFILAEIDERPLKEIATIEEVPLGTIKSRISRARAKLKLSLQKVRTETEP